VIDSDEEANVTVTTEAGEFWQCREKNDTEFHRQNPLHEDAARLSVIFIYAAHIRLLRFTRCYLVKFRIIYGYKSVVAN
jgi:hypothetical protein